MEWWIILTLIFGGLILLFALGLPVAIAFMLINVIGAFTIFGGQAGLLQLVYSISESVVHFSFLPVVLFILMGEVMFHTRMAASMLDTVAKWMGRIPGRSGLVAVGGGTLLSVMSGSTMASCAILGSVLVPEMEKHGYKKPMSLGPILGSGGLAMMIPPSALAVLLGALARIPIGKLLIAGIIPGLIMAIFYATYIISRCSLQPSLAPSYDVKPPPLSEKLRDTVRYILPLGLIIFLVLGLIFLGVATPTESAALGAFGSFILAAMYKRLNWKMIKTSFLGTVRVAVMVFFIIIGATAFSQILAFSGASRGLLESVLSLPLSPLFVLIAMQVLLLILGGFMEIATIMMITLPIFMPLVDSLGFNPIWFGVIYLLNMEMATTSPPFGLNLYVMKGVAPPGTTIGDCIRAALPFLGLDAIVMVLIIAFPILALLLPNLMF